MTDRNSHEELNETELDNVQGGIALLLPAVQSAREAARSNKAKAELNTDGIVGQKTTGIRASKIEAEGGGNGI